MAQDALLLYACPLLIQMGKKNSITNRPIFVLPEMDQVLACM
jgi:hypothetical protein